jgi:hypothetical protein
MKTGQTRWVVTLGIVSALLVAVSVGVAQALTFDEVIRLKLADVEEETILKVIEVDRSMFSLSVEDILDLRDVGCSNDFIRALIATVPDESGTQQNTVYVYEDYEPFDDDDYQTVFQNYYYDPFAYHWYSWPSSFLYYSPFWWSHSGFYYGGHWCSDWWDPWGPCYSYCDSHWGYSHHYGYDRSHIRARRDYYDRHGRGHNYGAATKRLSRERKLWQQAGLSAPASRTRSSRGLQTSVRRADNRSTVSRSANRDHGDTYRTTPSRDGQKRQYRDRSGSYSRTPTRDKTTTTQDRTRRVSPERNSSRSTSKGTEVRREPRKTPAKESKSVSRSSSKSSGSSSRSGSKKSSGSTSGNRSGRTSRR